MIDTLAASLVILSNLVTIIYPYRIPDVKLSEKTVDILFWLAVVPLTVMSVMKLFFYSWIICQMPTPGLVFYALNAMMLVSAIKDQIRGSSLRERQVIAIKWAEISLLVIYLGSGGLH